MIYTQHFDTLDGLRFREDPLALYEQIIPSVLSISTIAQVGSVQAKYYADFDDPIKLNSIAIGIVGSSGTFSIYPETGELFTTVGDSYGVYDPSPARVINLDYSSVPEDLRIVSSVSFGILRYADSSAVCRIDIDYITIDYSIVEPPEPTVLKGIYRYKFSSSTEGKQAVYFKRDGLTVASQCIEFKPFCAGGKILKFLDRNGMYRFFPFNEFWEETFSPDLIGETEHYIDTLSTAQSNVRSIGYESTKELALVAYDVTAEQLDILQDLYKSMRVYLYIGTTGDAPTDWLLVNVTSGTNVSRRRKGNTGKIEVTIRLPKQYQVTVL